ncbi:MAG: hypothetical protein HKO68_14275 [Desulfobacterales bacterium]|nr:hypothetical protein [Desulfobacterales bacterium]
MPVFCTLGPAGSNHELVTRRYIDFHAIEDARIELVLDFSEAVKMILDHRIDHIVQAAVHPATAKTVAANKDRLFLIDAFIAPSKELAVLSRVEVDRPVSLGLHPATKNYVDHRRWEELVPEISIVTVAQGLLAGKYDSGITAVEFAEKHLDKLRVDERIGTVDDVWLVYGTERVCTGRILAWRDSPAAALFRKAR